MCCENKYCRLGDKDDNDKLRDEMTDEETMDIMQSGKLAHAFKSG